MKKWFLFIFSLLITFTAQAQLPVTWDNLAQIRWVTGYDPTNNIYYDVPRHSQAILNLDKKEIVIRGFYVPIDADGNYFALSAAPSAMCFFCNASGLETVMEIIVKKGHQGLRRLQVDKYIELKGRFMLNMKSNEHLMYVLEDAELVQVLK